MKLKIEKKVFENVEWYLASDVDKLLAGGKEVRKKGSSLWAIAEQGGTWFRDAEYSGLLINIEPIMKETAEDVLRDYLKELKRHSYDLNRDCLRIASKRLIELEDRARKVLGES